MAERAISARLAIERDHETDVVKLRLYGELDLASAPLLESELQDVEASGHPRLLIGSF